MSADVELSFFEGAQKQAFIFHRRREGQARREKIREAIKLTGKLVCEVPGCGFDFEERYGTLGKGYAPRFIILSRSASHLRKARLRN
jgi:5-methylcytosine-specific restriction enzyme A